MKTHIILNELAAIAQSELKEVYCGDACVQNKAMWLARRSRTLSWKDMAREFRAFCVNYAKTHI